MVRRRRIARWIAAAALLAAAGSGLAWYLAVRRADRFLEEQAGRAGPTADLVVERGEAIALGRGDGAVVLRTATGEARDGAALGGRLWVATSGGLVAYRAAQAERAYTQLDGLSGVDLTAVAPLGPDRLVVGDAAGGLTLLDGERATPLAIKAKAAPRGTGLAAAREEPQRRGAIEEIAPAAEGVYALEVGAGVIGFDGRRATDVGAAAKVDLSAASALCSGPLGLAVGTRDGRLFVEQGAALQAVPASAGLQEGWGSAPVTALACDAGGFTVGSPFGVRRLEGGRVRELAADLFVQSLLDEPGALWVATFDDGVRVIDPESGRERAHYLAGQRVRRLRMVDGRVTAFGASGVYAFSGGRFAPLGDPPAGLSGPHVTALARDGAGRLWVGTFEHGIDLLSPALEPAGHLPRRVGPRDDEARPPDARDDQVNALAWRAATHEMAVATVRGVELYAGDRGRPLSVATETGGARDGGVNGFAQTGPGGLGLALGTNGGLTLVDGARAQTLYTFHGLANNHVYAVAEQSGAIYAGTLSGISIVEHGAVTRTVGTGPRGLAAGWVTALAAAPEGVYAGTYGGGVQLVHGDGTVENLALGKLHVNPGAMVLDGGTLWVGTLEAGLFAFDRSGHAWRHLGPQGGAPLLPSPNVTALAPDGDALLVGTASGLVRLPRAIADQALQKLRAPQNPEGSS